MRLDECQIAEARIERLKAKSEVPDVSPSNRKLPRNACEETFSLRLPISSDSPGRSPFCPVRGKLLRRGNWREPAPGKHIPEEHQQLLVNEPV